METGANPQLAQNWGQVTQARLFWRLVAQDTLSRGVHGLLDDLAAKELGQQALAALVALIV